MRPLYPTTASAPFASSSEYRRQWPSGGSGAEARGCAASAGHRDTHVRRVAENCPRRGDRRSSMALLLSLLWLLFGGLWMAIGWGVAAVIMAITIIGVPWARAA